MSQKYLKTFIGLSDIASSIDNWSFGFQANNIKTLKGSMYYQDPIQNSKLHFVVETDTLFCTKKHFFVAPPNFFCVDNQGVCISQRKQDFADVVAQQQQNWRCQPWIF